MAAITIQVSRARHYRCSVKSLTFRASSRVRTRDREVVTAGDHDGYSGLRPTQYHLDVVADDVALRVLHGAGFRVVSEESGVTGEGEYTVVLDPIDGSTNCDHGVPFFATSLAVLRENELVAALVVNQATGAFYEAEVGAGARRNGEEISSSG